MEPVQEEVPLPEVPVQVVGAVVPVEYFESSFAPIADMTFDMSTKRQTFTDETTGTVLAESFTSTFTWSGVALGEWAKTAAASPDTNGVAMLVQAMVAYLEPG